MNEPEMRSYCVEDVVSFRRTGERFGGLSNMAPGFPLQVAGVALRTSEALYQACRFPHLPEVQRTIIDQRSPMTAKMRAKPHRPHTRPDWDRVRVAVMKWCLRVKLAQHPERFGDLLRETRDRSIVEDSRRDDFWGAIAKDEKLVGRNVLGRLLMQLRDHVQSGLEPASVDPLPIELFFLLDRPIEQVGTGEPAPAKAWFDEPLQAPASVPVYLTN